MATTNARILYLEPFHGGSHRQFGERLMSQVDADWTALTLRGRHWKWRARGAAPFFALQHGDVLNQPYDLLWASSFLDLTVLHGLVPSLATTPSVLYFHENQLAYPVRPEFSGERDNHFGFSQMLSALTATRCVFNSQYNLDSFCHEAETLLRRMPDAKPPRWVERIRAKSEVLPVLMDLDPRPLPQSVSDAGRRADGPMILWNHRWEHDKAPEIFFSALYALSERGVPFRLIVCGERYRHAPPIFEQARERLAEHIEHWGYYEDRAAYLDALTTVDIAVSTARHEFFGLSMLEATHAGAWPVVPNRLSYVELFPDTHRYRHDDHLVDTLASLCRTYLSGHDLRADRRHLTDRYGAALVERYQDKVQRWSTRH